MTSCRNQSQREHEFYTKTQCTPYNASEEEETTGMPAKHKIVFRQEHFIVQRFVFFFCCMKTCWKRRQTNEDRSQRKRAQQANDARIGNRDIEEENVGDTREK